MGALGDAGGGQGGIWGGVTHPTNEHGVGIGGAGGAEPIVLQFLVFWGVRRGRRSEVTPPPFWGPPPPLLKPPPQSCRHLTWADPTLIPKVLRDGGWQGGLGVFPPYGGLAFPGGGLVGSGYKGEGMGGGWGGALGVPILGCPPPLLLTVLGGALRMSCACSNPKRCRSRANLRGGKHLGVF